MSEPRTLYLIDGHAQFFRAYYAIRGGMSSPVTGEATNLTFGFTSMLLKLVRDESPDLLAVTIDVSGDRESFRSELYPEYKANREAAPEDFHPQVERCLEILGHLAIPVIGIEGVEADDVIATIARRVRRDHPDVRVRIISRDKDLTQLLEDGIELYDANKDELVTPDVIFKTEGVEPKHVVDILALMGDSVDNVPGVPGIGPKTAAKLILQYGSVEGLLEHLDEIKGKRRENLEASRDQIPLSKQLVVLKDDVELDFDVDDAAWDASAIDAAPLLDVFRTLNFNGHAETVQRMTGVATAAPAAAGAAGATAVPAGRAGGDSAAAPAGDDGAGTLFAGLGGDGGGDGATAASTSALDRPPNGDYALVATQGDLDTWVERLRTAGRGCVDVETDSVHARTARLAGVALAVEPGAGAYVPVRSPQPDAHLDLDTVRTALAPLLADPDFTVVGHNLKYDMLVLRGHDMPVAAQPVDTMVADYLLTPQRSSHKMDAVAEDLLGVRCIPITDLIGVGGRGRTQLGFHEVALERAVPYAAEDADVTLRLADHFAAALDDAALRPLYDDVEMPLVAVLAEMEWNGIRVDPDELDRQREGLEERIAELVDEISGAAPHPFEPGSPKQLAAVLFNAPDAEPPGLGLTPIKRGKTGPSTDAEVLDKLAGDPAIESPIPGLIIEYRQLTKLVSTYLVALKEAINADTGRVHASFNQTVAATGRLSSSDPNLQNIPIRTDVGRRIRRAFVAEPGHHLLTADYSQIELRVLAHLAEDPALIEAFEAGADIHRAVAAEVFGVDPDDVTDAQRGSAKMVNFGIVYGITAFGLARRLAALGTEVSRGEAQTIIDDYKARFSGIGAFLDRCVAEARDTGGVTTILGRRRPIDTINARNPAQRSLGERTAINTVVQGSAADLIKVAMVDLHRRLPEAFPDARMLLQIHDELVFEVPVAHADDLQAFVIERMEAAMDLRVPLVVGAAHSERWIDAK